MENNFDNSELEQFMRRKLESVTDGPDDLVWSGISAEQAKRNRWLKARHYGPYTLLVLLLAGGGWLLTHQSPSMPADVPASPPPVIARQMSGDTIVSDIEKMAEAAEKVPVLLTHPLADASLPTWLPRNSVPLDRLRFRSDDGLEYVNAVSGSRVSIPARGLVYADGSPVRGEVELLYREYRNVPDVLASNIPMHYTDARGEFFFNSGGMFDVRVSQAGQEVFVAPGSTFDVQFAATDQLSRASIFKFDETKGDWVFAPEETAGAGLTIGDAGLPLISSEAMVARENMDGATPCVPATPVLLPDDDPAIWVRDAITTGRRIAAGELVLPKWFRNNPDRPDAFFTSALENSDVRLVYMKDNGTNFFPQDMKGVFTELQALKGYYFVRTGDTLKARGSKVVERIGKFSSKKDTLKDSGKYIADPIETALRHNLSWRRVEVQPEGGANCIITLGGKNEDLRLHARLCQSGEVSRGKEVDASAVFAEYERLREERLVNMHALIERLRHFSQLALAFQPESEWCMGATAWMVFFEKNRSKMLLRYDSLSKSGLTTDENKARTMFGAWQQKGRERVFERTNQGAEGRSVGSNLAISLQLTGFGLHNLDQIFRMADQPRLVSAKYRTSDGKAIAAAGLRILDRRTRMLLAPNSPQAMYRLSGRALDMILTATDGRVYYLPAETFATIDLRTCPAYTFTMEDVTDRVHSPLAWAELLGI